MADWKQIIEDARVEIETLEVQREDIDKKIAQLKKVILATQPMVPELGGIGGNFLRLEFETAGITDACRKVLETSGNWMSPLSVRSALESNGVDLTQQKNAMASIHTVLKRLREKNEVLTGTGKDGGTVYRWKRKRNQLSVAIRRRPSFIGAASRKIANANEASPQTGEHGTSGLKEHSGKI